MMSGDKVEVQSVRIPVLTRALAELRRAEDAGPFLQPVDWEDLGLLDYPKVIEQPMDLKTAGAKLRRREYATEDEFWSDVSLVWTNCQKYNEEGSEVYDASLNMQELAARLRSEASETSADPETGGGASKAVKEPPDDKGEADSSKAALNEDDWLRRQRMILCRRTASLPGNKLVLVINFLLQEFPEAFETADTHHSGRSTITRLKGIHADRVMNSQRVTVSFDKLTSEGIRLTRSLVKSLRKI